MQKGSRIERWNHTSHVLAMLHNASPNAETAKQPWQYNPHDPRFEKSVKAARGDISDLMVVLPKEHRTEARKRMREARQRRKEREEQ